MPLSPSYYRSEVYPLEEEADGLAFGMQESSQKRCVYCCGGLGLVSAIVSLVIVGSFQFLQPDDQVVLKSGHGFEVINGPNYVFLNPFQGKTWRKATLLDASQYAMLQHRRTLVYRFEYGPQLLFLGPDDLLQRLGKMTVLEMDEYIRLNHKRTGQGRVERGPQRIIVSPDENSTKGIEKAVLLNHETAVVVLDRVAGLLRLVTTCSHSSGPFIPSANEYVVEARSRIHILPHELLVLRDEHSRTFVYGNGTGPVTLAEGRCDGPGAVNETEELGASFFLQPYSKIVRMQWSDHSMPPDPAETLQQLTQLPGTSNPDMNVRRRRTSKNTVVLQQSFSRTPTTWLVPGDYDEVARVWRNRGSGADIANFLKSGTVRLTAESGSGTGANLLSLVGTTGTSLSFGHVLARYYTICSLTRYTGSSKQRILTGDATGGNTWYHGHYGGFAGVARYGWTIMTQTFRDEVSPDTEWVPMCGTNVDRSGNLSVLVGDRAVGLRSGGTPPNRLEVNTGTERSSFAIGELIIWDRGLSVTEMREAMDYLMRRLQDAKTYVDQIGSSLHAGPKRQLARIDLRLQKSFYSYQVRTNDNVRLLVEGCIFWRIADAKRMLLATADPAGDVYSRSRSLLVAAVSNVTFSTFTSHYGDVVDQAIAASADGRFFDDRGIDLQSIELTRFDPLDNHTQFILRRIIAQTTQRIVDMERQRSQSEIKSVKLAADIELEGMKTELIVTRSLNTKLEAEKAGATEGSGLARLIRGYLEALKDTFASASERLALFRFYWKTEAAKRDVFHLFNGKAKTFLVRGNGTAMWLRMPKAVDL